MSKFQDKLINKLNATGIAEKTTENYIKQIRVIYTMITGKPHNKMSSFSFLKDSDTVIKALTDKYAQSSKKTMLASIMKVLNISGVAYQKLYKVYFEEFLKMAGELNSHSDEKTPKQQENWVSLEQLSDVQRRYKDLVDEFKNESEITMKQYNQLLSYLIVSLYLDAEPERSENYFNMEYANTMDDAKNKNKNYYVDKEKVFIFNKYKTSNTDPNRGEPIEISSALQKVIDLYLSFRPTNAECFVAKYNGGCFSSSPDWSRRVSQAFGQFLPDKKIGSQMLRNIYFTEKYKDSKAQKEADAKKMKTSVKMIDKVYTKRD